MGKSKLESLKMEYERTIHDVCNQRDALRDQRDEFRLQASDLEKKLTDTDVELDKANRDAANALVRLLDVVKTKDEAITELRAELRDCYSMLHRLIKAKVAAFPF